MEQDQNNRPLPYYLEDKNKPSEKIEEQVSSNRGQKGAESIFVR